MDELLKHVIDLYKLKHALKKLLSKSKYFSEKNSITALIELP